MHPKGDSSKGALLTEVAEVVFHCVVGEVMLVLLLMIGDALYGHHFADTDDDDDDGQSIFDITAALDTSSSPHPGHAV